MVFVSIGKVCELLGISLSTAYRWIKSGKLKEEFRTLGNHRRFNLSSIHSQFIPFSNNIKLISDLGSGLNFKKSGLNLLLQLILTQQIQTLIINHKDRLLRFGSELIFKLCEFYHINVIIMEDKYRLLII
jgi:excisionase family DNA binding protein